MNHVLERTQRLPLPPPEAFEFFGDAFNLEAITPPWLHFRVLTERPIEMGPGTLISYRLRLHGIPVRWKTEIREWEPGARFRDVQLSGPYALWDHAHNFESDGQGGTLMRDRVLYRIPLGPLGEMAHRLFVRRDVERIFDHRHAEIARRFERESSPGSAEPGLGHSS